jgi:hypothetical protein
MYVINLEFRRLFPAFYDVNPTVFKMSMFFSYTGSHQPWRWRIRDLKSPRPSLGRPEVARGQDSEDKRRPQADRRQGASVKVRRRCLRASTSTFCRTTQSVGQHNLSDDTISRTTQYVGRHNLSDDIICQTT